MRHVWQSEYGISETRTRVRWDLCALLAVWALSLVGYGCGTPAPVVPWPQPPAPPIEVPPPPPEQPPVQPPVTPPADVDAALARIVLGGTLADAEAALGPSQRVPGQGATPPSARWTVGAFVVVATLNGDKVTGKSAVALGENP